MELLLLLFFYKKLSISQAGKSSSFTTVPPHQPHLWVENIKNL